jgi:hypothetical protein
MFNFKHFLAALAVAASTIGVCGQAAAMPFYRVNIDTASLGTGTAFLGMYFMGLDGAPPATATVNNLSGAFAGTANLTGTVSGSVPGPIVFGNANGGGELDQPIQLGGRFTFDVDFAMEPGDIGTTFGWALFNDVQYLGVDGDLGDLYLQPDAPVGQQVIMAAPTTQLGGVSVIPEPPTTALMLVAMLGMLTWRGKGVRRRWF